jgi:hypothetical protein
MHVVATNIILWIRTLVKESLEEISEAEEEHELEEENHSNETVQEVLDRFSFTTPSDCYIRMSKFVFGNLDLNH